MLNNKNIGKIDICEKLLGNNIETLFSTPNLEALSFKLVNMYILKQTFLKYNTIAYFNILNSKLHCYFWWEESFSLVFEVNFGFLKQTLAVY